MSVSLADRPNRAPKRLSLLHTTSSSASTLISSNPFSPSSSTSTSGPRPLQLLDPSSPGPSTAPLPIHSPIASPSPTSSTGSRPSRLLQSRRQSSISYVSHDRTGSGSGSGSTGIRHHQRSPSLLVRSNSHNTADSLKAARVTGVGNGVNPERKSLDSSSSDTVPADRPPLTLVEKHADLLQFIAQKEAKCLDLRSQLATHEAELLAMKRKWERIVSRGVGLDAQSFSSASSLSSNDFSMSTAVNPSSKHAQAAVIGGIKEVGRFIAGLSELGSAALPTPLPISTHTSSNARQANSKGTGHTHRQSTSSTSTYATTSTTSTTETWTGTSRFSQSSMSSAGTGGVGECVDLDSGEDSPNGRVSFDELPPSRRRVHDARSSDGESEEVDEEAENTVKLDNIGATATFSPNPAAPTSSSSVLPPSPMKNLRDSRTKQGHGHESLRADITAAFTAMAAGEEERKLGSPSSSSSNTATTATTPDTSPSNTSNPSAKATMSYHTPTPRSRPARPTPISSASLLTSPTSTPSFTSSNTATSPTTTNSPMPPFSTWVVGTATKKWEELQKSQKRASVLLSDVSTSFFAALSPPPAPTPSSTTTALLSGSPRRSFDHADLLESGVGGAGVGIGGFGGSGSHSHSLIDADDDDGIGGGIGSGGGDMGLFGDMVALSPDPYSSASRPSMRTDSPSPQATPNEKAIREEDEEEWNW
ncbi:hypothetical protein BD410DRAFT_786070 [Rickenella mellea]|uniref:DUF4048 domain-containing protein n=1 Tax=Rickenella mellea TaxID=50990 RepID=A0A4Y7QCI5_9AGAM|nr:hypothetical protein BD410DRAFT_786070 [Rickenella mellea]